MDLTTPITQFFGAIGSLMNSVRNFLERALVIYPFETVMRLWYRLDPRVYSRALRIVSVTEGGREKRDDTFFVFVLYSKGPLPEYLTNVIDAIDRSGHNLIVVSNFPLTPLQKARIGEKCHTLIERKNVGRDFGGYKDGVEYVLSHFPNANRIILVNDSLFFFRRSLDKLIADLNGPHDFIGVTETQQFHYHVQSFMLSFGPAAIRHPTFRKFWAKYRPLSTRYWAIHRGEVRLTRQMTRAGFRPHILFPAAHLYEHLQRRPVRDAVETIRLLPRHERKRLYKGFLSIIDAKASAATLTALETVAYGVRQVAPGRPRPGDRLQEINNQAIGMDQWSLGIFPEKIISAISRGNQMHNGAFLFMRHMGLPILKRDIFFRQLYTLEEIHQILTDLGEPLRDDVLADLRRIGSSEYFRGLRKILYRHGMI